MTMMDGDNDNVKPVTGDTFFVIQNFKLNTVYLVYLNTICIKCTTSTRSTNTKFEMGRRKKLYTKRGNIKMLICIILR